MSEIKDIAMHGQVLAGNLKNSELAMQFMFGGNATFTVKNVNTGNRFTFRVKTIKDKKDDPNAPYFIGVLTGPDNNTNYTYLGTMWKDKKEYKHSPKSTVREDAMSVRAFKYVLDKIKNGNVPKQIEIWHEGRCGRCGRKLSVPESVASGFGPECVTYINNFVPR